MKNSQKGFIAPILIVIVLLVIGGSIYFYSRNTHPTEDNLTQKVSSTDAGELKTYSTNEYQFNYPSQWTPLVISQQSATTAQVVNFLDTSDKIIATLQCPIREVGYEAWSITSENRELTFSGTKHGTTLLTGAPKDGTGLSPLIIIFMYRNSFPDSWGNTADDHAHSCELRMTDTAGNTGEIFRTIYESVSPK